MIGVTIGNFRIVSKLGRGGMGEVFLAEQTKIGTKVAIKMLLPELSSNKDHVDRFFNEALAVSKIKHAGIVRIFDVGFYEATGSAYLIMELLEGESLAGRIARSGRLTLGQISDIGRQIASVLDATHAEGVTHRDLKPDNIFLIRDAELASRERVKILDFGIAKLTGTLAMSGPKTVGMMGTPAYMAPEQWGDSSKVDWRADAYSLGCVAFEMACGRTPFVAETFPESFAKHLTEPPPLVRMFASDMPEPLETLIVGLLAKKPEDRPASMTEVARRFEALGKNQPGIMDATMLPDVAEPVTTPVTTPVRDSKDDQPTTPLRASKDDQPTTPVREKIEQATKPVPPVRDKAAAREPLKPTTTFSGSAGEQQPTQPKSRTPMLIAIGAVAVLGGGTAIYLATRGTDASEPRPAVVPQPAAVIEGKSVVSLRERIEVSNPFVDSDFTTGSASAVKVIRARLQTHQVSDREYRWYLASLPQAEQAGARPVSGWSATASEVDTPVVWVSFERARAFCKAIGATLPTSEQWIQASHGAWGLDPAGTHTVGPFEEWTSTTHDGLATVLGGHAKMDETDKQLAIASPMWKATETLAGADAAPQIIASAVIGFRCAR